MLRVHHLNCVEIESPGNGSAIGHCLLLEQDEQLVMIDVGIGLKDTEHPAERIGQELISIVGFRFSEERTAYRQIQQLGLDPAKVSDCVISHLDPDHIGGLADFPQAVVHVGFEEFEHFKSGHFRYLPHQLEHRPVIKTYEQADANWMGFEARSVSVLPGTSIYLIPLFGHTFGHCGVAIEHGSSIIFYTGDAYYLRAELDDPEHPVHELAESRADDNALRLESLEKIRQFIATYPDIPVYGYHDISEWESLAYA